MQKELKDLTEQELIIEIFKCDKEISKMLSIAIEHYPGAIMGIGDFYIEKYILTTELLRRKYDSTGKS